MLKIKFPNGVDVVTSIDLDGVRYFIRLLWNDTEKHWSFSLRDKDNNPLVEGIKVVRNYPFLQFYHTPNMPQGEFMVISGEELPGRNSFANETANIVYMTREEYYGTV